MILSSIPIVLIDILGSILMIILSFLCLLLAHELRSRDQNNVMGTYLLWLCFGLTGFAMSRSVGHILKQILLMSEQHDVWNSIRPYSGAINSIMFVLVGSVTLFFERIWVVYQQISKDKKALQFAHEKLVFLNQNLEQRVAERTEELVLMEKQMAQAEKLASIGQLSAGVAHEINNPLGIILGYTQLLLKNDGTPKERNNDLKTIEKHAQSCKSIVEDLLNFARESGPKRQFVQIHDIIDDALNFIQNHSDLDSIQITTDFDPQVPTMALDPEKMKQVFINLIMNAKHAVDKGGVIKIATQFIRSGDHLSIKVSDNGHGIEKKNLSRIFDPFFTTKPTGKGTGLGLSVSYGIIKNHGGDISVESELRKGSIFTIMLPVVQ